MNAKPLTIALDFDDTFTADPELWTEFIGRAKANGHRVVCVTGRHYSPEDKAELKAALPAGVPIYFTEQESKTWYMAGKEVISIWIDDNPRAVVHGH